MGLFGWFYKKTASKRHNFDDRDREASIELREKRREIELLKMERESELHKLKMTKQKLELQAEIDELTSMYSDDEPDVPAGDDTTELIKFFAPMFMKNFTPAPAQPSSISPPQQTVHEQAQGVTNEQLRAIWAQTPAMAKNYAKKADDKQLRELIRAQLPGFDEETVTRAIAIIRE